MTTDPVANYKEALRECELTTRGAERVAESVNDAAPPSPAGRRNVTPTA